MALYSLPNANLRSAPLPNFPSITSLAFCSNDDEELPDSIPEEFKKLEMIQREFKKRKNERMKNINENNNSHSENNFKLKFDQS